MIGADTLAALCAGIPVGLIVFAYAAIQERAGLAPVLLALGGWFAVRSYLATKDLFRRDQQLGFWSAHQALGGSLAGRVWRYGVRGGWQSSLLAALSFHLRVAVAAEASLSFLGFGIQEPQPSFGNMLASHFDLYLKGHWAVLGLIVGALALTALFPAAVANLIGRVARRGAANGRGLSN